ncbi:MAG TPA: methyltransferase domain-containing protein [Pyrinomonadaceae bacterium]|nr:methyltransferase domain-containing protein [Pyrinomonadaceae bacterium]
MSTVIDIEGAVNERYGQAAHGRQPELCCPTEYDPQYLNVIPDEIKERDYGCGDPSAFVREGDVVLDLGSGGGKICYIAAQIVGPNGKVIGIDANDEMLALAEKHRHIIGRRIGYHNVEFRKGRIQDLRLDLALVDSYLAESAVASASDLARFNDYCAVIKADRPLVADESIDLVLSNCVLNLVRPEDKKQLFEEMFRVVRRGGRVAISDIVSDEDVPAELQRDPELWSGCISGAYREDAFLDAFNRAGFYGMEIIKRDDKPWRRIQGIEFRSITVVAHKGKQGPCWERKQAVIYRGPWRKVIDDDGHVLERGKRMAVCDKTFQIYKREPYADDILPIVPYEAISLELAAAFDCRRSAVRDPRETKGLDYDVTDLSGEGCCEPGTNCC